jgi:hypothetical protein
MKAFLRITTLCILIISCNYPQTTVIKTSPIQFYHRVKLGLDPQTYDDFLALADYKSHPKTAAELYKIAKHYIDTVKAKLEVNSVTFLAKDVDGPKLYWDAHIWNQEKEYCLITFEFNHFKKEFLNKPLKLNGITLWKDALSTTYDVGNDDRDKWELDSILKSPKVLQNVNL